MSDIIKALNMKQAWGVYALYFMISGAGAVTPAIAAFGAAFPDASPMLVSMIQTLPSITIIIGTLAMGAVVGKKIKFKTAGIVSLLIYLVFGCMPAVWNSSLEGILIIRALTGFGMGFVAPLGAAAFLRLVDNKEERSKYLGRGGAMQQLGCVAMTLLGGVLAGIDWTLTFWAYGLCLVALIIFVLCFEEPPSLENTKKDGEAKPKEKTRVTAAAWFFVIIMSLAQMFCSPALINFSTLMAENIPGQDALSVAAAAGLLLSVFVLAGAASSAILDKFMKVFGKFTGFFAFLIAAIGIAIIAFANSEVLFGVGILVFGFGWCLAMPMANLECGNVVNKATLSFVVSLMWAIMNVGNFLSSYWLGAVYSIVGVNPSMVVLIGAILFVILGIIWAVFNMNNKAWKKSSDVVE